MHELVDSADRPFDPITRYSLSLPIRAQSPSGKTQEAWGFIIVSGELTGTGYRHASQFKKGILPSTYGDFS